MPTLGRSLVYYLRYLPYFSIPKNTLPRELFRIIVQADESPIFDIPVIHVSSPPPSKGIFHTQGKVDVGTFAV